MSKCENCIHYDRCDHYHIATDTGKYAYQNIDLEKREDVEDICDDFKDKSLFVELPCKVGDEVWEIRDPKIFDKKIVKLEIISVNFLISTYSKKMNVIAQNSRGANLLLEYEDFGKTVFFTEEEAKAKLKEIEGK